MVPGYRRVLLGYLVLRAQRRQPRLEIWNQIAIVRVVIQVVEFRGIAADIEQLPFVIFVVVDELITPGMNAIVSRDAMKTRVFVEMVVQVALLFVGFSAHQRQHADPVHGLGRGNARGVQQGWGEIDILHQRGVAPARGDFSRPLHQ